MGKESTLLPHPRPDQGKVANPANPRGAIPVAREALGAYATSAKRSCGVEVLHDSVYVVVHPIGMTCSACNIHAYVVKFREGGWKVWTAY